MERYYTADDMEKEAGMSESGFGKRIQYAWVENKQEAIEMFPWAIKAVELHAGGFICFESHDDFISWIERNQRY